MKYRVVMDISEEDMEDMKRFVLKESEELGSDEDVVQAMFAEGNPVIVSIERIRE